MKFRWLIGLLLLLVLPASAQTSFTEYEWTGTEFSLVIPTEWDAPLPGTSEDGFRQTLLLAQNFATNPAARPPATPIIEITALPILPEELDLSAELRRLLQALDIRTSGTLPGQFLGQQDALFAAGSSTDEVLFGLGHAVQLPDGGAVFLIGRAATAQRESFTAIFNTVANSLVQGSIQDVPLPQYGIQWRTERTLADSELAFLDIGAITLANDGMLYLADAVAGLVQLDPTSGTVLSVQPFADQAEPTDIAISPDGIIYIADVLCGCVRVFQNGTEVQPITGFGQDAPRSIALSADGTLYATDSSEEEAIIRTFTDGEEIAAYSFADALFDQPLLASDQSGRVFALSVDFALYGLQEDTYAPFFVLESGVDATDFTFDANNNVLVTTLREGLLLFDNTGLLLTSIALDVFGELRGVTAGQDGTLYIADGDGSYGAVSALRLGIAENRIGAADLLTGREVSGSFSEDDSRQVWYYEAQGNERVTITTIAADESFDLDVALRVLAPNGAEIAFIADDEEGFLFNPLDAQLRDLLLQQPGLYAIVVEKQSGSGAYHLGISAPQMIEVAEGTITINGVLRETIPAQRYTFSASGGQTLTITLSATSGTLDPLLRLLDSNGNILAENDDAEEINIGTNAQIYQFDIPFSSTYTIEAGRFDGTGEYTLEITVNP